MGTDQDNVTLMCLHDLSAEFDTVDHELLIERQETEFRFQETVIAWIDSFIRNRRQTVVIDD